MQISTFMEDLLGLEDFANRLNRFIQVEHQFVDGSLVIGLNSKFGTGKTTFLRMWKNRLAEQREDADSLHVISLNAWESDYYGDPLFSLVSSLVSSIEGDPPKAEKLKSAAKDVGWFLTAIGNQIVRHATGVDAIEAGAFAEEKQAERDDQSSIVSDSFSIYEGRKAAMESLKAAIADIFGGDAPKALILVDELDRCRPDYAVSYLETIKHIFDIQGLVFVLAVDRQQLECSAKTAFGADLDFSEYYRKFVQREVSLPKITDKGYEKLAYQYVDTYLQKDGIRNCFMELSTARAENIKELIFSLQLTPRQIQEVFRLLGHVLSTDDSNKGRLKWCYAAGTILMASMKIGYPKLYSSLGYQSALFPDVSKFFMAKLDRSSAGWWSMLCWSGLAFNEDSTNDISLEDLFLNTGLVTGGESNPWSDNSAEWNKNWGHPHSSRFVEIHSKIEEISTWG